jgi:hypothetical protein
VPREIEIKIFTQIFTQQLTAIDFDFMRIKATLKNEFPLMSLTELAEYNYYITPFTSTYL